MPVLHQLPNSLPHAVIRDVLGYLVHARLGNHTILLSHHSAQNKRTRLASHDPSSTFFPRTLTTLSLSQNGKGGSLPASRQLPPWRFSSASSAYSGSAREILTDFGVSQEVFILGVSLFALSFALGPLVWARLSNVVGRQRYFKRETLGT